MNTIKLFLLTALLATACTEKEPSGTEPGEKEEVYSNSFAVRCELFTQTKSSAVENDDASMSFTWSASDAIYPIDEATGKVAGKVVMEAGDGLSMATLTVMTNLEAGARIRLQAGSKENSIPKQQTCNAKLNCPDGIFAKTDAFELSTRFSSCSMVSPAAFLKMKVEVPSTSGAFYACSINSIELSTAGSEGISISAKNYSPLYKEAQSFWAQMDPAVFSGKDLTVSIKATSKGGKEISASTVLPGREILAGKIYCASLGAPDEGITPKNQSGSEFTYSTVEVKSTAEAISYSSQSKTLPVTGMNYMPRLNANTLDRWGGYDGVKPDEILSSNPAGFWRTGKYKGRWVMVNPDGNVTILHGINGAGPDYAKAVTTDRTKALYNARFANTREWCEYANTILTDYGFNLYSSNPQRIRNTRTYISESDHEALKHYNGNAHLAEVAFVYFLRTFQWDYYSVTKTSFNTANGSVFTLMFDPDYLSYIEALAKDAADLYKNDKNFVGYYLDNELQFRWASSSAQGIYLKQWLALGSECRAFSYAKAFAENFMKEKYGVEPVAANVTTAMDNAFLAEVSDYYYRTTTEAMHHYDSNHLLLGSRLHGKPKTLQQVHEACAKYCDVVSVNIYGVWEPDDSYFINQFKNWVKPERPIFVTEFYTRNANNKFENEAYANTGEGGGWIVKSHADRGIYYQNFTRKLISYDHCIGWQWFQMTDDDLTGYGWNNKGIISPKYVPYYDLVERMRQLHWNIYQIMDYYFDKPEMMTALPQSCSTACWEY